MLGNIEGWDHKQDNECLVPHSEDSCNSECQNSPQVSRNEKCLDFPFWEFKSTLKILYKPHCCSLSKGKIVSVKQDMD